jgi:hypothetical protein
VNAEPRAGKLLVTGNIGSGKSELARALGRELGWRVQGIDDARRRLGDGSPAGEARAWGAFLAEAEDCGPGVLECTGGGPFVHLLRLSLRRSALPWALILVRTAAPECVRRAGVRGMDVPYPDFGVPLEQVVAAVERELCRLVGTVWPAPLCTVNGEDDAAASAARVAAEVRAWLAHGGTS